MKLLVDSDFLVANYKVEDSLHIKASKMSRDLNKKGAKYYCLNLVVQEATTVISKHMGMENAKRFYTNLNNFIDTFIILSVPLEQAAWSVFLSQTKKGTSFVDCANLAAVEKYKLNGILSFDEFYPKSIRMAL